jgi:hypothetical protein
MTQNDTFHGAGIHKVTDRSQGQVCFSSANFLLTFAIMSLPQSLKDSSAYQIRVNGISLEQRLVEYAELSSFVVNGVLLPQNVIASTDPAMGPICTTNLPYWCINTTTDWENWLDHEMQWLFSNQEVSRALPSLRLAGWRSVADTTEMLLGMRNHRM